MATFVAIKNTKQTMGSLLGVLRYVAQDRKTLWQGKSLFTGYNCVPRSSYLEFRTTKKRFHKTDGRQFYHFVQSFSDHDKLTPQQANEIGLELAEKEFPNFEVVVTTHVDTGHIHNHLVVNSVSCVDGKKLHQNAADLQHHWDVNDQICQAHGLSVLPKQQKHNRKKRMEPGEYQAGLRGVSWKLDLIYAINEALEYAGDRETFIANMEQEGYQVKWLPNRKHITFITPDGYRCRDSSLHDETFLKENLEWLFLYRQLTDFEPGREEPSSGWLYGVTYNAEALTRYLEQAMNVPDPPPIPVWTESKQRQREVLKKLALGQRLENLPNYGQENDQSFGLWM